jgi:hypothetical protein
MPCAGRGPFRREDLEEAAEIVGARPRRVSRELLHDPREDVRRQHVQVFGEHRPDALEQEIAEHREIGCLAIAQALIELGDEHDRLAREFGTAPFEDGLAADEEVENVEVLRQVDEIDDRTRLRVHRSRLPDLEAVEGAQDDVTRRRRARRARLLPVRERLLAVPLQVGDLAWPLHLDDADTRPEEIHETAGRSLLEASADGLPVDAVALEQLIEERLRLGPLRALVAAPARRELAEPAPDLVLERRHDRPRASTVPWGPRRRCHGGGGGPRR